MTTASPFHYELLAKDGRARRGRIHTAHGTIETPIFMPVGTIGSVKAMRTDELRAMDAQIILGNTYHLFLRPGMQTMQQLGGLHKFMDWDRPILTDSAGFQIYSLSKMNKVREEGCTFRSHIDGSKQFISPEISMEMQHALGATITMAFDECTKKEISWHAARRSWELTKRWGIRSREAFTTLKEGTQGYAQYGIVQGARYEDLRRQSAEGLQDIGFEGYAIGGYLFAEEKDDGQMFEDVVGFTETLLPEDKPRYVMGAGYPSDMLKAIALGVDQFDCVLPTRNARNGQLFTSFGTLNIGNAKHKLDESPVDDACSCHTCRTYSRAYLHHLFKAKEILALMACSHHNIHFYLNLMRQAREHISAGTFHSWKDRQLKVLR